MKNYLRNMSPLQWAFSAFIATLVISLIVMGHSDVATLIAPAAAADIDALATEFKAATSDFKVKHAELVEQQKEVKARLEKAENLPAELKEAIDKALVNFKGVSDTVTNLEQQIKGLEDGVEQKQLATKSWGQQFIEGSAFKSASENGSLSAKRTTVSHEIKQVNSAAAGGLIRSLRENDVVNLLRERRVVRDLLRTVPVSTSSIDYVVQTTRTNAAAPVAESAAKPYSDYAWGQATVVVRTLAHLAKITRQAMDDAPRLMGELDSEMRYGLGFVEERQFLYGTGVGQNLHGIMPQATPFAVPAGFATRTGVTKIDVLRVAMLQNSVALLPADGIVLNEIDWADIELTKTTEGAYLFANPQGSVDARMWTLPVVATPAINAGEFLVGAFQMGATIYDRMAVEVLISTENVDDFEKNLATMRAEERVAIAVKRPQAFTKGVFADAIELLTTP